MNVTISFNIQIIQLFDHRMKVSVLLAGVLFRLVPSEVVQEGVALAALVLQMS